MKQIPGSLQEAIMSLRPGQFIVFTVQDKETAKSWAKRIGKWIAEQKEKKVLVLSYTARSLDNQVIVSCSEPIRAAIFGVDEKGQEKLIKEFIFE